MPNLTPDALRLAALAQVSRAWPERTGPLYDLVPEGEAPSLVLVDAAEEAIGGPIDLSHPGGPVDRETMQAARVRSALKRWALREGAARAHRRETNRREVYRTLGCVTPPR